jgi:ribosomal protein S7
MLVKEYIKKGKYNFALALKKNEYNFFLNKFYGTLISRGRKGKAMRMFDDILVAFKERFKSDPFVELQKAINNLIPILSSTQKKLGKVYHAVPSLAVGKRRFVIMLSWIIKKQKNKNQTRGINSKEVAKHLIDAVSKKGLLMKLKSEHLAYALSGKHLLYMNRKRSFVNLRDYKRRSFRFLLSKEDSYTKRTSRLLNYAKIIKRHQWKKRS